MPCLGLCCSKRVRTGEQSRSNPIASLLLAYPQRMNGARHATRHVARDSWPQSHAQHPTHLLRVPADQAHDKSFLYRCFQKRCQRRRSLRADSTAVKFIVRHVHELVYRGPVTMGRSQAEHVDADGRTRLRAINSDIKPLTAAWSHQQRHRAINSESLPNTANHCRIQWV